MEEVNGLPVTVDLDDVDISKLMLSDEEHNTTSPKSKRGGAAASKGKLANPLDWGFPGYLTREEVDVYIKVRSEVEKRGGEFKKTVYSFTEQEGEENALTRWLRARKYKYDDVILMIEQATACRAEARDQDFYPDPTAALGVDPSIFISQYPQLYYGYAKNGCPVFYSKPGELNIDGLECITTLDGIIKFHWHVMQHDYVKRLLEYKKLNPSFSRFECITILDLNHLTTSHLSERTLGIVKKQAAMDSLCFPETMNKMIIVNAPLFFSVTWKLIKGWLDPRTASKVEVYSSTSAMESRLLELIDDQQLPCDYGGKAPDTKTTLASNAGEGMTRLVTKLMHVRSYQNFSVELGKKEEMDVFVYTRGTTGATFSITDENKVSVVSDMDVTHVGSVDEYSPPTSKQLNSIRIKGPANLKIRADSKGGRFSPENFLVVCSIY